MTRAHVRHVPTPTSELKRLGVQRIPEVATTLTINDGARQLQVEPWTTLLDLLRDELHLVGHQEGLRRHE